MAEFEKYVKDGEVAVLYSPEFGAGWYSWNKECGIGLLFDKEIITPLLEDKLEEALNVAKMKYPNAYLGGFEGLSVKFLPAGTVFRIDEYDGSETIVVTDEDEVFVA